MEDGTVSNRGTKDSFLLCFLFSSQTLLELLTRNLSILLVYFTALVLGTYSLCSRTCHPPNGIQNRRKPLVVGLWAGNPQNKDHDTLR